MLALSLSLSLPLLSLCLCPSAGGDNPAEKLTNGNLLSEMKLLQLCKMAKNGRKRKRVDAERESGSGKGGCVVCGVGLVESVKL